MRAAGRCGGRGARQSRIHHRVYFNTADVDVADLAAVRGVSQYQVPRIAARTRAAAAGPPRRPTQARGPENSGGKFDWKIPIKWILKICIGNPLIKF